MRPLAGPRGHLVVKAVFQGGEAAQGLLACTLMGFEQKPKAVLHRVEYKVAG